MSMCSYCIFSNSNHTMRLYRVSDIRTDNYIVVSGSRTTAPFIIQEEWNALATKRLWPPPFRSTLARLYLPHIGLVLSYLIRNTVYAVTIQNRGLWRVAVGFTDFKSRYCRRGLSHNFRVGSNQIPLCSSQKRKAAYIPPENRGYVCTGSNLLPENSGYWPGGSVFW